MIWNHYGEKRQEISAVLTEEDWNDFSEWKAKNCPEEDQMSAIGAYITERKRNYGRYLYQKKVAA